MRNLEHEGVRLQYPDEIAFAFNPSLFILRGSALQGMKIVMDNDQDVIMQGQPERFVCYAKAFSGRCVLDISEYIRAFFDGMDLSVDYETYQPTDLGRVIQCSVSYSIMEDDGTVSDRLNAFVFDICYIWGALRTGGEVFNGYKHLTWFTNYPFTMPLYKDGRDDVTLLFSKNGRLDNMLEIQGGGRSTIYNIAAKEVMKKDARYYIVSDFDGKIKQATFDLTFDLTFYGGTGKRTPIMRIDLDNCENGVYLRWIDRHGMWRYWLFKQGGDSRKVTKENDFIRNDLLSYDMVYGYQGGTGRRSSYSREDTWSIGAPLVDSDTFDMLQDMTASPIVDMFAGYGDDNIPKWVAVSVNAGTYKKTDAVLQDFTTNIILPEVAIQKL